MRRRDFITLLSGSAVAWPLSARSQQPQQIRRIGVLLNLAEDDPETRARLAAFFQALQELGWSDGRNLRIDYRWGVGDSERHRKNAAELVALGPDVIVAHGSPIVRPLQRDPRRANRVCVGGRSGRRRLRRKFVATGRQHHRVCSLRIWPERKMAGVTKAGCAAIDASSGHS